MTEMADCVRFVLAIGAQCELDKPFETALGAPPLAQLDALAQRWHDIEERVRELVLEPTAARPFAAEWPPLFTGVIQSQGYELCCLASRDALETEGLAMRHCVGAYARRAAAGHCQIVSVARNVGRRGDLSAPSAGLEPIHHRHSYRCIS